MEKIELAPEARAVLDRIRHSRKMILIHVMPADLAEAGGRKRASIRGTR